MASLLERLGVALPVVQAGMGGGLSRHELAAAVSEAGGLGTIAGFTPESIRSELAAARKLMGKPLALNLLLPYSHRRHFEAAAGADVLVTFWGKPRRRTERTWIHQCGSMQEARAARHAGADGLILQGVEAGGHVRGTTPALELLEQARRELPDGYPLWLAGDLADATDVKRALDAGAEAAVLGTRFLMSEESRARNAYKQRLMESRETVLTELFGLGWPAAPHRVIWNEATERWLRTGSERGPGWVLAANRLLSPPLKRIPESLQFKLMRTQRANLPFLSPQPLSDVAPSNLLDAGPLYAGQSVARIHDIRPAGELVRELAEG
jgi:nitronate monooxygenase